MNSRVYWAVAVLAALVLSGCATGISGPDQRKAAEVVDRTAELKAAELEAAAVKKLEEEAKKKVRQKKYSVSTKGITAVRNGFSISIARQWACYFRNSKPVRCGYVATGTRGHATPRGRFSIGIKQRMKISSLYPVYKNGKRGGARMPYSMQVNGNIFMHQGRIPRPGRPASHGCIRVGSRNAAAFYSLARRGDAVYIY